MFITFIFKFYYYIFFIKDINFYFKYILVYKPVIKFKNLIVLYIKNFYYI